MYKTRSNNIQRGARGKGAKLSPQAMDHVKRADNKFSAIASSYVGKIVNGNVFEIGEDGARVDVDGVGCFIHISQLSESFVSHPDTVLSIGESYIFRIIKIGLNKNQKISFFLSLKSTEATSNKNPKTQVSHFGNTPFNELADLLKDKKIFTAASVSGLESLQLCGPSPQVICSRF
jgi:ribosomal protein S1